MPIYEYVCDQCGNKFEALVANSSSKSACPSCGSKKLTKQFSTFAAHADAGASPCAKGTCPSMSAADGAGGCGGGHCPFSG